MAYVWSTVGFGYKFLNQKAIDISDLNVIALCTEDAVKVLDFQDSVVKHTTNPSYCLADIKAQESSYILNIGMTQEDGVGKWTHITDADTMEMVMDNVQTSKINSELLAPPVRTGYRKAVWSPVGVDPFGQCVLVTLTMDHRLSLYAASTKPYQWLEKFDLSNILREQQMQSGFTMGETVKEPSDNLGRYKHRLYCLISTFISWCPCIMEGDSTDGGTTKYGLLVTTMKSGHLVLWRISCPLTDDSTKIDKIVYLGEDVYVKDMAWYTNPSQDRIYLVMGCDDGRLLSLSMADYSITTLWEDKDQLAVTTVVWDRHSKCLLAAKGVYIIIFEMDTTNGFELSKKTTQVVSGRTFLTNICVTSDNIIYVATTDATILFGNVVKDSAGIKLKLEKMVLKKTSGMTVPGRQQNCGLVATVNHAMVMVIDNPSTNYCDRSHRAPMKLHIICSKSEDEIYEAVFTAQTNSLQSVSDLLLLVKNYICQGNDNPEILNSFLNGLNQKAPTKQYTVYQLKVFRYIVQLRLLYLKSSASEDTRKLLTQALSVLHTALVTRQTLSSVQLYLDMSPKVKLSDLEMQSLQLMKGWLENPATGDGEGDPTKTKAVLEQFQSIPELQKTVQEKCVICNADMSANQVESSSCTNGHPFDRCGQTLLACQAVPYRKCQWCGVVVYGKQQGDSSAWFDKIQTNDCPLCDHILLPYI